MNEHAEDVTAEAVLPVRQQWACTRGQLEDALANAEVRCDDPAGPRAGWVPDLEALATSVLNQLPLLGDDLALVGRDDLREVLERCAGAAVCAGPAWERLTDAAGMGAPVPDTTTEAAPDPLGGKVTAPWPADQVASLNAFQHWSGMHPFTCGNAGCPGIDGQKALLAAAPDGWICPAQGCSYRQAWAHGFMADWSWRRAGRDAAPDPGDLRQSIRSALDAASGGVCEHCVSAVFAKQADAVLAIVEPQMARLAELEHATSWDTACTSCARVLDSCIRETERAERAEAEVARLKAPLCDAPDFVTRLRMIADQDIGGNAPALADELHALASRIEANARGEDLPAYPIERVAADLQLFFARLGVRVFGDESDVAAAEDRLRDFAAGTERRRPAVIGLTEEDTPVTLTLPGLTAVRFDRANRVIAVDGRNSRPSDEGVPCAPEWAIRDLRDGIYGGFHRLLPAGECFDAAGCASQGQHDAPVAGGGQGGGLLSELPEWEQEMLRQEAEKKAAPPLPPGEFARVEIMGRDKVTGFVTERTRAGQPVMVISDWDGRVIAEIPGHALYRFTPLPTPLKRPESVPQPRELMSGSRYGDFPDDDHDWRERDGEPF